MASTFTFVCEKRGGSKVSLNRITNLTGYRLSVGLKVESEWIAAEIELTGMGTTDCTIEFVDEVFPNGKVKLAQPNSWTTVIRVPRTSPYKSLFEGQRCIIHTDPFQQGQKEAFAYATAERV